MPLWGATDSDESKPKNLTTAEKKQVFANASGWVLEAGSALSGNDNASATPEVLVAIGGLATSIGAADITEYEFITTAFDKSDGGNIDVRVRFNEAVDVTGTPRVSITNGNQGAGSGRGVRDIEYLGNPQYGWPAPPVNQPATSGYGGSGAANSGSGGGAGAQEPKFAPPPGSYYASSFPHGGNGGPGLVLIAYPQ